MKNQRKWYGAYFFDEFWIKGILLIPSGYQIHKASATI
jgi:hypothetical protein